MRVLPVPCLKDNYAYLLTDDAGFTAVVDASEAGPVRAALAAEGLALNAILSTHHHWDHVGGNEALAASGAVPVYGYESDVGRLPGLSRPLQDGATFTLGALSVRVLHIPGHTLGAVAYVVSHDGGPAVVFTGDTLFVAGCGRLFEGTPAQMLASLERLAALPEDTAVYCGHEYTESNLRFASWIEPDNDALLDARREAEAARGAGRPTVPSSIAREKGMNPFLRTDRPEIRRIVGVDRDAPAAEAFAAVRKAKNGFKG